MPTSAPLPGDQLPVALAQEVATAAAPPRPYANRVCIAIADSAIAEAVVRRWLGDTLPIRVVSWSDRAYDTAIRRLRPRVIVVLETTAELAWESGNLVASLYARFEPSVLSAVAPADPDAHPRLILHQLGVRAEASVASLKDLTLA